MKKNLQSFALLLALLMMPMAANAAYVQLAEGVYQDGMRLYITSGVTSLGSLQLKPNEIYCYAMVPPSLAFDTFTAYGATLHVPATGMVSYFTALYWNNFTNVLADAIEPQSVTLSSTEESLEVGKQLSLLATVAPSDAMPQYIYWSSTNAAVATVNSSGTVTAVGIGDCYICATCIDKQALCHLTVTSERVTITLDQHEARLLPNHLLTLNATCSPSAVDLTVTSSNPAVALPRLVNGTIQVVGIAEGIATITVNSADGWGNPDQCVVTVYTELGDVNSDGFVNIADVTTLIDYILGDHSVVTNASNADTDRDNIIGIADVTTIIDYILADGNWPWETPGGWVDLGLPSGTLWATCNIGASSPDDGGNYFAWGETSPKNIYSWNTYKWCDGSVTSFTKYCTNGFYGTVDNRTELLPEDDAAYVNWGPSWRIPTWEQMQELIDYCTWSWTTRKYTNGYLVTGSNGNTIFLPAASFCRDNYFSDFGLYGRYWSRTLDLDRSYNAVSLHFESEVQGWNHYRNYGFTVRAVRISQE